MENENKTVEDAKIDETGKTETQAVEKVEEETKTFTQAEIDKILKDRLDREKKKLPSKEELDEFKKYKESQKTETEKQAEVLKELEMLKQEKVNTQRENTLLKKGVNSDDVDYVLFKVSKMEGEFEDNLETFLKENEKFTQQTQEKETTGVANNKTVTNKSSGYMAILKAKHPELYK